MTIKERLAEDLKVAMKAKDKVKLTIIRLLMAEIKNEEINEMTILTEDKTIDVVNRTIKQTNETLDYEKKRDNKVKVQELETWIEILTTYLPAQLTEDEARALIAKIVADNGFTGKQDMGKAMKVVMPQLKGRFNGKLVNKIVGEVLA